MGKKIDYFVLSVLSAIVMYLYFRHTIGNHTAALTFAGIAYLLLAQLIKKLAKHIGCSSWMQKRRFRKHSRGAIMHLACMDPVIARGQLTNLLKLSYGCDAPLELVQAPPTTSLSQEHVFELWKTHRSEERLVICSSCPADNACKSLCASLKQPEIALLDAAALTQLFSEHPQCWPAEEPAAHHKKHRFKQLSTLMIQRRNALRCLLFSMFLLVLYLLGGRPGNLIASMALLFLTLAALKRPSRPAKLF